MGEGWQVQYFQTTNVNPQADEDRDGLNNLAEYIAGTNPRNGESWPGLSIDVSGTNRHLNFPLVTQRVYAVDYRTNLFSPWVPLITNIVGTRGDYVVPLGESGPVRFYRYRVRLAP